MNWRIVPYRPGYETALLELESTSPQGSHIRLEMIRDHIATSLEFGSDDFDYVPFSEEGGMGQAGKVFGGELKSIIAELNEVLVA